MAKVTKKKIVKVVKPKAKSKKNTNGKPAKTKKPVKPAVKKSNDVNSMRFDKNKRYFVGGKEIDNKTAKTIDTNNKKLMKSNDVKELSKIKFIFIATKGNKDG